MLLLLAIALVLIGVVTLVIGIISNTLAWVFISIAATVAAGIVLYVLYRLGRKQAATATAAQATEPAPAAPAAPVVPAPTAIPPAIEPRPAEDTFAPVSAGAPSTTRDMSDSEPEPTEDLRSPVATAASDTADRDFEDDYLDDSEDFFPIAEYEELRVAEILPLLPELDAEELDVVREREASTKARATILNRIDELAPNALGAWSDGDRGEEATETAPATPPPPAAARPAPSPTAGRRRTAAAPTPSAPTPSAAAPSTPSSSQAASGRRSASASPIAGYDDLKVAEILPILTRLGTSDLQGVAEYERRGPNRQTILNRIEGRLRFLEGRDSDGEAAPPRRGRGTGTRGRGPATPEPTALPTGRRTAGAAKRGAAARPAAAAAVSPGRKRAASAATAAPPAPAKRRGRPPKDAGSGLPVPASFTVKATKATKAASNPVKATRATKATKASKKVAASPRSRGR